jgi:hypothetical protein
MAMNANQTTSNQLPSMAQHQIYHQISQQQTATNNLENFSPKHFSTTNNNSSSNNKVSSSSSQVVLRKCDMRYKLTNDLFCKQGFQGSNNNSTYTQQSNPIPIDTNHQRQQHSPLHHQSYPNNQISADKLMSYRNANTASPANLSSSQGNLSKVFRKKTYFHAAVCCQKLNCLPLDKLPKQSSQSTKSRFKSKQCAWTVSKFRFKFKCTMQPFTDDDGK